MIQFDNAVKRFSELILGELYQQNIVCWVAGGAVRDYFMGKPIKTDIDIFFPNEENYNRAFQYLTQNDGEVIWESPNDCKIRYKNKVLDLVKKYFDTPQKAIEEFDFTISMFAVDDKQVYYGETSFIDLAKRQLMFNKITYPASTLKCAFRYYEKGFVMCIGEMAKLYEAIQNAPKQEIPQQQDNEPMSNGELFDLFIGID